MIKSGTCPRPATLAAKVQAFSRCKWFFSLAIAVLFAVAATPNPTQSESPDELYIRIMAMIDRADALQKAGQTEAAKAKYADCEKALLYFKATNPLFAPKTVGYRLKEVTEKAEARPQIAESTNTSKTTLEAPAPSAKSGVKLLEPGAEPRSKLRFHLKAGDKQVVVLTMKVKMDLPMPANAAGGAPPAVPAIPAITMPMDMTVQSVAANGDITYQAVMGEPEIKDEPGTTPEVVQAMKTTLAGLKGLVTTGVMTDHGVSKKVDIKTPATADAQTRQMMDQMKEGTSNMNVPFPEEPVGVGAKWETKKVNKVQGISVEQTGTYELISVDGDKVGAKMNVGFTANGAKTAAAPMQMSGSATGSINLDLSKLVGPSANMDMHMEMPIGTQAMKMDMNMSLVGQ